MLVGAAAIFIIVLSGVIKIIPLLLAIVMLGVGVATLHYCLQCKVDKNTDGSLALKIILLTLQEIAVIVYIALTIMGTRQEGIPDFLKVTSYLLAIFITSSFAIDCFLQYRAHMKANDNLESEE